MHHPWEKNTPYGRISEKKIPPTELFYQNYSHRSAVALDLSFFFLQNKSFLSIINLFLLSIIPFFIINWFIFI